MLCTLRGLVSPVSPHEVSGTVRRLVSDLSWVYLIKECSPKSLSPSLSSPWMREAAGTEKVRGRMEGGVQGSGDDGKADPVLIGLVRESSGF